MLAKTRIVNSRVVAQIRLDVSSLEKVYLVIIDRNFKMRLVFLFCMTILVSSCQVFNPPMEKKDLSIESINKSENLEWNYGYSSDVLHAVLIRNNADKSNSNRCKVYYSEFKVIESFKGNHKVGEIIKSSGIGAHETEFKGSEHLLFLNPFIATGYPGYGDCDNQTYVDFLTIHNWCCSIDKSQGDLIMYDMLDSETSGDRYLVSKNLVFNYLRDLKKNSKRK